MNPVDFDPFLKMIGGSGVLSLLSQITSFFSVLNDMKKIKAEIDAKRKDDPQFPAHKQTFHSQVENDLVKVDNNSFARNFFLIFILSLASAVTYSIAKDIHVLSESVLYLNFIGILSYVFFIGIPIFFVINVIGLFSLYHRLNRYRHISDLSKYNPS